MRVITRLNIGGPARQALLLTRALRPELETVLVAGTPAPEEGELADADVDVVRVPLVRPVSPSSDLGAVRAIRQLLHQHRPAIVHTHMAKAGTVGRAAALSHGRGRRRPRLVHTFHGHVLDGYFGAAATRTIVSVERALARATDILVAVSPEVRDQLLALRIGRPEQYRVIPLGIDLQGHWSTTIASGALRSSLGLSPDVPLVGIVGRIVPIKDHATLLHAMVRVPHAHLAIVGDGDERATTERIAHDLGLTDRVHFAGWRLDMADVLSDLDVVALSSRNEGTPVALIEAAACGRPVVATDVGGVRSVVEHGAHGLVVPPGDPAALGDAISELLSDPACATAMGARARVDSHRFDSRRLVEDIRSLYEELLA